VIDMNGLADLPFMQFMMREFVCRRAPASLENAQH
jgi:hypothetical protein